MKKVDLKSAKRIDSPLAKYNASGQLFCVLCNQSVKNEMVWTAHINGRAHRDNLQQLKAKKRPQGPTNDAGAGVPPPKKAAIESGPSGGDASNTHFKTPLPVASSSSSHHFAVPAPVPRNQIADVKPVTVQNDLRQNSNSFQSSPERDSINGMEVDEPKTVTSSIATNGGTSLPEGFFDDPKLDAKARGLEYRDPEEIEWENFVKEIASEEVKSSTMRVEDEEESTITRELDEIEEQMTHWQRVVDLEKKAEEIRRKKLQDVPKIVEDAPDEDDEDEDYSEELDWRSKKH